MDLREALAVVDLLVPADQLVTRARQISSAGRPLGCIRDIEDARYALGCLVRQDVNRLDEERRIALGWTRSNRYPFGLRPPKAA